MNKPTRILTTVIAAVLLIAGSGTVGYQLGSAPPVYTTNYSAMGSGWLRSDSTGGGGGDLALGSVVFGFFNYGANRMNELQGRTILSGRIYLPRVSGAGSVTMQVYKGELKPSTSLVSTGGWVTVPLTRINELVQGTGFTQVRLTGSGTLKGAECARLTPSNLHGPCGGTIQVTWSE